MKIIPESRLAILAYFSDWVKRTHPTVRVGDPIRVPGGLPTGIDNGYVSHIFLRLLNYRRSLCVTDTIIQFTYKIANLDDPRSITIIEDAITDWVDDVIRSQESVLALTR